MRVRAHAPGRVTLIGDHTDYTGGLCLPMAIDRGTTVTLTPGGPSVRLRSRDDPEPADIPLDVGAPHEVRPLWARYVAGVVAELAAGGTVAGGHGDVATTLPLGAGLSSSAALEVAVALALGAAGTAVEIALLCRRAEERASGVPCGVMDQMASLAGVAGHALLLDCAALTVDPVRVPDGVEVVVAPSGEHRRLATSAYAERRADCERAAAAVGPLRTAGRDAVEALTDPRLRRRARHVVTENERVERTADALRRGDVAAVGRLMAASHASLRDDFEVSTPRLDGVVDRLTRTPGVLGARLTGAGFGGCAVALVAAGTEVEGWRVRPSAGARVVTLERAGWRSPVVRRRPAPRVPPWSP